MAEQITFRKTQDLPSEEAIQRAMSELGLNKNQLITEGIKMMVAWDKTFYSKMKAYAEGVGLSMAQVMQNFLIKRLADEAAEDTVWGTVPRALVELPMTNKGLVTGKELFDSLYASKVDELFRERAKQLQRDKENGLPLSAEDKEILKKYGNA